MSPRGRLSITVSVRTRVNTRDLRGSWRMTGIPRHPAFAGSTPYSDVAATAGSRHRTPARRQARPTAVPVARRRTRSPSTGSDIPVDPQAECVDVGAFGPAGDLVHDVLGVGHRPSPEPSAGVHRTHADEAGRARGGGRPSTGGRPDLTRRRPAPNLAAPLTTTLRGHLAGVQAPVGLRHPTEARRLAAHPTVPAEPTDTSS